MKHIFTFLFLLLMLSLATISVAQDKKTQTIDEETLEDEDLNITKIMVIPFNPSYYKRDIDKEVKNLELKEHKEQEIKAWFSFGLDENIAPRIISINHEEKKLLNDYSTEGESDMSSLYASIEYREEKREKKFLEKNSALIDNLMGKIKDSGSKSNIEIDKSYESDKKHKEYLNAHITDPSILPHLSEKYGVKLFVFINKFEIFTNYKKCLDEENKIFQREIKISFSVYSNKGDQLYGDLAVITFYPSITKDIDQLIMERFPVVSNYFSAVMPDASTE
jgi:hypothetical protein